MKYSSACAAICALVLLTGCSQSPEKLLTAANKYHQNKKYQEASILYRKVLLKDKTNAEAYYREGLNLLDQAKVSDAASYLRRAVDLRSHGVVWLKTPIRHLDVQAFEIAERPLQKWMEQSRSHDLPREEDDERHDDEERGVLHRTLRLLINVDRRHPRTRTKRIIPANDSHTLLQ